MLADVPMVFILVGITAYTVLSGADFGAGLWTLIPGGGRAGVAATREHTRHAIGPVWEANHVWLIFVLTVVVTMVLVWVGRFALARASAALAVAAVIAGWAAAQEPRLLPGLTVAAAAAPRATLIATIIGVAVGALVLVPSLGLLYTLVLRGRLDTVGTAGDVEAEVGSARGSGARLSRARLAGAVAVVALVSGVGLLVFGGPAWVHGLGALLALACAVIVFGLAAGPPEEPAGGPPERT